LVITDEGFAIALGYLYSSEPMQLLLQADPRTARAVLASALLLGGMDELADYAYETCRGSISLNTLDEWLGFVESLPSPADGDLNQSIFGRYTKRIRDDVHGFLVVSLPHILQVVPQSGERTPQSEHEGDNGWNALLNIYARLPFELFKDAVESPAFPIGSDQARFKFAKAAVALRKQQGISRDSEETVVLAFGGAGGSTSAVHITRKLKKRPLWKVSK
jgi:hypothetical protein